MKQWCVVFFVIWSTVLIGQPIDFIKLEKEITKNNRKCDFETSIVRLQRILISKNSSALDKAQVYFLKQRIYRRLGIYTEAINNLDLGLEQALKTDQRELFKAKYELQMALIACEKLDYQTALTKLPQIRESIRFYQEVDFGLYLFLEGIQKIEGNQDDQGGLEDFKQAILLLKEEYPTYLTIVYKEQLRVHIKRKEHDKIMESYNLGIKYGEESNLVIEVLNIYRLLSDYYQEIGRNEESLALSEKILITGTTFDAVNISSKLNQLEKEVLAEQKEVEQIKNRGIQKLLLFSLLFVCILIACSFIAYRKHIKNKKIAEKENQVLKTNLQVLQVQKEVKEESIVLTERQECIIALVKQGKTNKEIAAALFISENTVKYHLKIIYDVLKVNGRSDLI